MKGTHFFLFIGIILISISTIIYSYTIFNLENEYRTKTSTLEAIKYNANRISSYEQAQSINLNTIILKKNFNYSKEDLKGLAKVQRQLKVARFKSAYNLAFGKYPSLELLEQVVVMTEDEMASVMEPLNEQLIENYEKLRTKRGDIQDKKNKWNITALILQLVGLIIINIVSFKAVSEPT